MADANAAQASFEEAQLIHTFFSVRRLDKAVDPAQINVEGFLQHAQSPEGYRHTFAQPLAKQKEVKA